VYQLINRFLQQVGAGEIEVYNEFSLQHELGIFLRGELSSKVQFERNVSYFGIDKSKVIKREIDISIFNERSSPNTAIELKFPRNGQHPEQLFSCCRDIKFLEGLKEAGFEKGYFILLAEDALFYSGNAVGIYSSFRSTKELSGRIVKPTGKKDSEFILNGSYHIHWQEICGALKCAIVEV